tara:strand:- start:517 stop:648 length:132 start_codon:yes stop_codon:yes gene_type:complete
MENDDIRRSISVLWQWVQTGSNWLLMDLTKKEETPEQSWQRYS